MKKWPLGIIQIFENLQSPAKDFWALFKFLKISKIPYRGPIKNLILDPQIFSHFLL